MKEEKSNTTEEPLQQPLLLPPDSPSPDVGQSANATAVDVGSADSSTAVITRDEMLCSANNDSQASRPSIRECLNLPDEELADLSLDVYNMFFLSDVPSQAFFYSIAVLITKMSLYFFLLLDLTLNKQFPFERNIDVNAVVKLAQLFLIPVSIMMQEELQTTFYIYGNLEYTPEILNRHPGAHLWKYYVSHLARFVDGFLFLFINTMVMLQTVEVLSTFLNFAALMFLQTIDNVALQVCLDGYWTQSLQNAAKDVVDMKFAIRRQFKSHLIQFSFFFVIYVIIVFLWAKVHYLNG
ncbi:hypothetical protein ACHAXS_004486 [Conticribra weissflogii]